MVKKQEIKSRKELKKEKIKIKNEKIKNNNKLITNSKMKTRLKLTKMKLKLNEDLINTSIKAIIKINSDLQFKTKVNFFENITLNILLKQAITEDLKLKNIKRKRLIKLPISIFNNLSNQKVLLVINEDTEVVLDKLKLSNEKNIEILNNEEFINLIKNTKNIDNLNFIYHSILIDNQTYFKSKQILKEKQFKLNILQYQDNSNIKSKYNNIANLYELSVTSSILKNIKNKNFAIKIGNTGNTLEDLVKSTTISIYKLCSFLLENSQKHNSIKCLILKSENSIPFNIYNEMQPDDLQLLLQ